MNTVSNHLPAVRAELAAAGHNLIRGGNGAYLVLFGEIWGSAPSASPKRWVTTIQRIRANLAAQKPSPPPSPQPARWAAKVSAIRSRWRQLRGTPKSGTIGGLALLVRTPNTHTPLRGESRCAAIRVRSDAGAWAIAGRIRTELEQHFEADRWARDVSRLGLMKQVGLSAFERGVTPNEIRRLVTRAVRHTYAASRHDGLTNAPAAYFVGTMRQLVGRRSGRSPASARARMKTELEARQAAATRSERTPPYAVAAVAPAAAESPETIALRNAALQAFASFRAKLTVG